MANSEVEALAEKVEHLAQEFEQFKNEDARRWDRLIKSQEDNTEAIKDLTQQTAGVVQLYNDVRGASRLGAAVQAFTVWLAKLGFIGGVLAALINYALDHFEP